ncbi:MAG: dihydropteroate synthase [Gemmatimonadales bacterium]|nr:MAG: dihydropteroate synthase [Gemmatimonadales bacterium]
MTGAAGPHWALPGGAFALLGPRVMGILNVTPDSFSDGGELASVEDAVARGRAMVDRGADLLDVGGESTRPGADPVSTEEELGRVVPVVKALAREVSVPLSVDTRRAPVARAALEAGASIVNDVSGLAFDEDMAGVVARARAGLVLMHMRGTPRTMMDRTGYDDVVADVTRELALALDRGTAAGIAPGAVVVDPGLGFAKTPDQSFRLLGAAGELSRALGRPVLVGPSRKSFLGALLGLEPRDRVRATAVACALAVAAGARIVRVHDVAEAAEAVRIAEAVRLGRIPADPDSGNGPVSGPAADLDAAVAPGGAPGHEGGT